VPSTTTTTIKPCGPVKIYKFYDANQNGIWEDGESLLPGFVFDLNSTRYSTWVATGSYGYVIINCLPYGEYTVTERHDDMWNSTTANPQTVVINDSLLKELGFGNIPDCVMVTTTTSTTTTTAGSSTTTTTLFDNKIHLTRNEWQLISVPKPLDPDNFSSVFEPDDVLLYYDNAWKLISDAPLNDAVLPLWGFWALSAGNSEDVTLSYSTNPLLSPPERSLAAGWNLIGHGYTAQMTVHDALYSIDGKYAFVIAYEGGGWKIYTPSGPSDFTIMKPGQGYWIFMTEPAILPGTV